MTRPITSDHIEAYSFCPRKAFLLITEAATNPGPHAYELFTQEKAAANRDAHQLRLANEGEAVPFGGPDDLAAGWDMVTDADLATGDLQARCDILTRVNERSREGTYYEPVKVIGTSRPTKTDLLSLTYQGIVLGEVQDRLPVSGTLVRLDERTSKVKLAGKYKQVWKIVE